MKINKIFAIMSCCCETGSFDSFEAVTTEPDDRRMSMTFAAQLAESVLNSEIAPPYSESIPRATRCKQKRPTSLASCGCAEYLTYMSSDSTGQSRLSDPAAETSFTHLFTMECRYAKSFSGCNPRIEPFASNGRSKWMRNRNMLQVLFFEMFS